MGFGGVGVSGCRGLGLKSGSDARGRVQAASTFFVLKGMVSQGCTLNLRPPEKNTLNPKP